MRFRKFNIPTPNPWRFPSRYPYFILEGNGRTLSEDEQRQIKAKREAWRPSKIANDLNALLASNVGKQILLYVENPENYYDTPDELPKPFIARLEGTTTGRLLDQDIEFDQLFIVLSNPRHLTGENIFNEYDFDYDALVKPLNSNSYKINFNTVIKLGIQKKSFWDRILKKNNGS